MLGWRRGAAAVLGVAASGMAVWAMVSGRQAAAGRREEATIRESRQAAAAVSATALRQAAQEAIAAAAVPQLRAAIKARVDALTLEDLFATEEWWLPFRDRALILSGLAGTNAATPGGAAANVARPRGHALPSLAVSTRVPASGEAVTTVVPAVGTALLVAVTAIEGVPGHPVLSLARPIQPPLLSEWGRSAGVELVVTDGRAVVVASDENVAAGALLVGREKDDFVSLDGRVPAAAVAAPFGEGLWLWAIRPAARSASGPAVVSWPWGASAACAILALLVMISARVTRLLPATANDPAGREIPAGASEVGTGGGPREVVVRPASGERGGRRMGASWDGGSAGQVEPSARRTGPNASTLLASGAERTFGRYSLVERIGEGGMSEIYFATLSGAEGFQRTLVIKRLKPDLAYNRSAVDQFIDEAKLGSLLIHSNIAQVFDFGETEDGYYMALEHIVGRNLGEILERHVERVGAPLDIDAVFFIAHEVLQALAYAHERTDDTGEWLAIVHRDVSPGNIVVGVSGQVKLIDFGIVKAEVRVSHTDLGNVKGNPAFMAPEQARGRPVDARSDLFSLGLVMYHALTNELMYEGDSSADTLFKAAGGPVSHDLQRIAALPKPAARVLSRALSSRPDDRYQNAEEFAADLTAEIRPGAKSHLATLMNALFGPELRPHSGGTPGGATAGGASGGRRFSSGFARKRAS